MSAPLLQVDGLSVAFESRDRAALLALDRVSISVADGECVALVGPSGSGKTTLARAILGLLPDSARVVEGSIRFEGQDLLTLDDAGWSRLRGKDLGLVLQEPAAALHPMKSVESLVGESLLLHRMASGRDLRQRICGLLEEVGLPASEALLKERPHRLSGGMRQRIGVAAAVAGDRKLLIADEPTTALDAILRRQVLDLLERRRRDHRTALILVSHDLDRVARRADRWIVLDRGRVAEEGPAQRLLEAPSHPVTKALVEEWFSMRSAR
ncbi:MAG: ABC transporter ATP-binding protein [Planctomycetes bacterium]|nr:ABC transporter ATP-binding protein [Planctomycetota bacterium]